MRHKGHVCEIEGKLGWAGGEVGLFGICRLWGVRYAKTQREVPNPKSKLLVQVVLLDKQNVQECG